MVLNYKGFTGIFIGWTLSPAVTLYQKKRMYYSMSGWTNLIQPFSLASSTLVISHDYIYIFICHWLHIHGVEGTSNVATHSICSSLVFSILLWWWIPTACVLLVPKSLCMNKKKIAFFLEKKTRQRCWLYLPSCSCLCRYIFISTLMVCLPPFFLKLYLFMHCSILTGFSRVALLYYITYRYSTLRSV